MSSPIDTDNLLCVRKAAEEKAALFRSMDLRKQFKAARDDLGSLLGLADAIDRVLVYRRRKGYDVPEEPEP